MRALFVSHDGMLDPLGGSQILSYVTGLAAAGVRVTVLTFEKPSRWQDASARAAAAQRLRHAGVRWIPLRYRRWPPVVATALGMAYGVLAGAAAARRERVDVLHARGYVGAAIALGIRRRHPAAFVFDMRGFWVDERVEGGLWPAGGWLYRAGKRFEAQALRAADAVVTLTERSRETLLTWPALRGRATPVTVIPTCVDLERFMPAHEPAPAWTFLYAGSAGTWYQLDAAAAFVGVVARRQPAARLLVVTPDQAAAAAAVRAGGLAAKRVLLAQARHDQMPGWLQRGAVGLAFYRPGLSRQACCPTKIGEYLACGLPVVATAGIGDTDAWLEAERVGVLVSSQAPEALETAAAKLKALMAGGAALRARCRDAAERRFGLGQAIVAYEAVYRTATAATPPASLARLQGVAYAVHGN